MGYLPIIVALSCFVFLWGLVNHHSIKRKKKEAQESASLLFKSAALRNKIVKQMHQIADIDPTIHTVIAQIQPHLNDQPQGKISVQQKLEAEQEVSELINRIPSVTTDHQSYQNVYRQLLIADHNYRKAATLYRIRLQQYNELVTRPPSKFVAKIMGWHPVASL